MTKVYIIGAGRAGSAAIEEAKRILELKPDVEIICVGSRDEIPFRDRLSSNPATIQEIIPLRPNIPLDRKSVV
jgi:NADH dehydrogenase FAD-containing subunit